MKNEWSPQKNAELYYRKAKNHQLEIQKLNSLIEAKEKEINELKVQLADIGIKTDLRSLRESLRGRLNIKEKKRQAKSIPYKETEFRNFKIWVGRNAAANDELTLTYAAKDDLWLHARDTAGSHVVVKWQAGRNFPKDVIERAAQLAAYNSGRKNENLCPVVVTTKKFVRKRKGAPAGAVIVEKEKVILVEPKG